VSAQTLRGTCVGLLAVALAVVVGRVLLALGVRL
jgi:hypothetical protein